MRGEGRRPDHALRLAAGPPWFDPRGVHRAGQGPGRAVPARYAEAFHLDKSSSAARSADAADARPAALRERVLMRVLLTGHQGYLGTVLAPVLAAAGHEVTGLDSGLFADCVLGPAPADPPGLAVDLRDVTVDQLAGFDAVVHLAALSNDPLGALAPELTYEINHRASTGWPAWPGRRGRAVPLRVDLLGVRRAGRRRAGQRGRAAQAGHPVRGVQGARRGRPAGSWPTTTSARPRLRNATAFGFSPRLRADIVLNNLVGHALLTGEVKVLSDGTPWRPLVHAPDIAAAVVGASSRRAGPTERCTPRRSTSAPRRTTDGRGDRRRGRRGGARLRAGDHRREPAPTRVPTGSTSPGFRAAVPGFTARWTIPAGAPSWPPPTEAHGLTRQGVRPPVHPAGAAEGPQRRPGSGRRHVAATGDA
jgi:hypothetical protein